MKETVPMTDDVTKPAWQRRKKKYVKPEIQWNWIAMTMLTIGVTMVAQAILVVFLLTRIATQIPNDGESVIALMPQYLVLCLGLTVLFLAPLLILVAVLVSFRIAGPIHRLEMYLRQVIAGEKPPDCRLRAGDQLKELCELVNSATAPLRRGDENDADASQSGNERIAA
jgi:hypothetical protein